jgi:hypothetical protein
MGSTNVNLLHPFARFGLNYAQNTCKRMKFFCAFYNVHGTGNSKGVTSHGTIKRSPELIQANNEIWGNNEHDDHQK